MVYGGDGPATEGRNRSRTPDFCLLENDMLVLGLFLFNGALLTGCRCENVTGFPENVTVHVIDSRTVEIIWSIASKKVDRYDVTYNPAEDKIVTQAAGNSRSIVLRELRPNTQYQVTVSAVVNGKGYKSPRMVFRTGNSTRENLGDFKSGTEISSKADLVNPDPTAIGSKYTPQTSSTVRGVEIGLVLLALVVWIIAISLFFHRWGKIRMLLPYQPDYKTQQSLKVPGTGTTASSSRAGINGHRVREEEQDCVQSTYEKVTSSRCCCECIAGDRTSANEDSDFDE